jgi:SAM-dependent methyltransferase
MKRARLRLFLVAGILGLAAFYAGARYTGSRQIPTHPLTGRPIAGIATNSGWLDRAAREREEEPDRALQLLEILRGMTVADIGAGTGYMTLRLAQLVGPGGKVFANDVQRGMLEIVERKAQSAHVTNIEAIQGTETDARLPKGTVDLALLVDVYHEFRYPQAMLRSVRSALKPDGRLVFIEYRKEDPRIPIAYTHRMSVAEIRAEVEPEGFAFERAVEDLPRQHIVRFRRGGA